MPCACLYAFTRCIKLVLPLPAMPITIATVGLSSIDALEVVADALAAAAASLARCVPSESGAERTASARASAGDAMAEATGSSVSRGRPRETLDRERSVTRLAQ